MQNTCTWPECKAIQFVTNPQNRCGLSEQFHMHGLYSCQTFGYIYACSRRVLCTIKANLTTYTQRSKGGTARNVASRGKKCTDMLFSLGSAVLPDTHINISAWYYHPCSVESHAWHDFWVLLASTFLVRYVQYPHILQVANMFLHVKPRPSHAVFMLWGCCVALLDQYHLKRTRVIFFCTRSLTYPWFFNKKNVKKRG
jgi:hypothetical protein